MVHNVKRTGGGFTNTAWNIPRIKFPTISSIAFVAITLLVLSQAQGTEAGFWGAIGGFLGKVGGALAVGVHKVVVAGEKVIVKVLENGVTVIIGRW